MAIRGERTPMGKYTVVLWDVDGFKYVNENSKGCTEQWMNLDENFKSNLKYIIDCNKMKLSNGECKYMTFDIYYNENEFDAVMAREFIKVELDYFRIISEVKHGKRYVFNVSK